MCYLSCLGYILLWFGNVLCTMELKIVIVLEKKEQLYNCKWKSVSYV